MKQSMLLALVTACAAGTSETPTQSRGLPPGDHTVRLRHDGVLRDAIVHVPPAAVRGEPLPAMLAFHGGGGTSAGFRDYAGLDAVADSAGFLVVYPDGTGPLRNRLLTWNAGGCCGPAMQRNVDDVGFIIALLADLDRRTPVDERRVYATGHSNGAMMAYRLAAEHADRIAAIVPVGGAMMLNRFAPSRAVPVLHIHSVDDPRALYEGGLGPPFPGTNNRVDHKPVQDGLDQWIRNNGCSASPTELERRSGRPASPEASHTAVKLSWTPCTSGADVMHWRLTVAGHGWPGQGASGSPEAIIGPRTSIVNAAREAWAFASRYTLR
jgi:polyhydroxybutyrate depolymerase